MKIAVIALTKNGSRLAVKVSQGLGADIYIKPEHIEECRGNLRNLFQIHTSLALLVGEIFNNYDALVFVMACGIVVRAVASHISSKTSDPAVVVMDEKGQHAISLLSGHIGGANRLAARIAGITGGTAVITTATDVNSAVSFDLFALENDCVIENIENLKYISAELVNGGKVALYTDCAFTGDIPENIRLFPIESLKQAGDLEKAVVLTNGLNIPSTRKHTLILRPKNLVLGIGCKRGTEKENIKAAIEDFLKKNNKSILSVKYLSTIDLKQDEEGILTFCEDAGVNLKIIPRAEIEKIEKEFTCSEFVKRNTGVASVAEPCAFLGSDGGMPICGKTAYSGITLALSEIKKEFRL